jgi:hypothetical protein
VSLVLAVFVLLGVLGYAGLQWFGAGMANDSDAAKEAHSRSKTDARYSGKQLNLNRLLARGMLDAPTRIYCGARRYGRRSIRASRAANSASVMSLSRLVIASAERCRSRDCAGRP